jgi:hypothetical protein
MITAIVLVILGIALIAVLRAMLRGGRTSTGAPAARPAVPAPQTSGVDVDLWNARPGDVVSIRGGAEDYSDLDFTVDRRSAYESNNHRWVDLSGDFRGRRVYLEVQHKTDPEALGILDGRKLTIADLHLTEQQLTDYDARQDPNATLEFEGKKWQYESSREVGYFENETGEGEGLYRWLFREQGGPRVLCIEKWEGEPFDVRIARRVSVQEITVYRAA